MTQAREAILARLRASLEPGRAEPSMAARRDMRSAVRPELDGAVFEVFERKCVANLMQVKSLAQLDDVPACVAGIVAHHAMPSDIAISPRLASLAWPAPLQPAVRKAKLEEKITVVQATAGIAETGSLVVCSGDTAPSSLTFAAELSIIVVARQAIVAHLEDGLVKVRETHPVWPRAVNLVSGPSRTADVAGIVVRPAHGPKAVYVLVTG